MAKSKKSTKKTTKNNAENLDRVSKLLDMESKTGDGVKKNSSTGNKKENSIKAKTEKTNNDKNTKKPNSKPTKDNIELEQNETLDTKGKKENKSKADKQEKTDNNVVSSDNNGGATESKARINLDLEKYRSEKLSKIDDEIYAHEKKEIERVREIIEKKKNDWNEEQSLQEEKLAAQRQEIETLRGTLSAQQDEINRKTQELNELEKDLEDARDRFRTNKQQRSKELDEEVEELIKEKERNFEAKLEAAKEANDNLRKSIKSQTKLLSVYEDLKKMLGGDTPEQVMLNLNSKTDEITRLQEELATRPAEEIRERFDDMENQLSQKQSKIDELKSQLSIYQNDAEEVQTLRNQNIQLDAEKSAYEQRATIFEASANKANAELDRLKSAYESPEEEDARKKEIDKPFIKFENAFEPIEKAITELEWLEGIKDSCEKYGMHFNPRLLKAFHTSLKTAEWAPLTVLAGVSGTGKSELPRLYSHFGGLYFAPVSVQPNWDSQESMLGFFNSIDNRFDAQPVLNFLAQSQKPWVQEGSENDYPGLSDAVCLVLLDEMNLAHPELYFAEFLSKLELRRGTRRGETPFLPVKLGAGMNSYELPLGRNVLWVGTMNQDETTKSLSDKVLDRSIVLNFPRPTELKRRKKLEPLNEDNRGEILHKRVWGKWCQMRTDKVFDEKEILPYKSFIEDINNKLGVAGRAIGHRVWQSVEYYMANYPDVIANLKDKNNKEKAMHEAFEDQLVQKVMPKLRGIDTSGQSMDECLEKIRQLLNVGVNSEPFNLEEDFEQACRLGYGQFVWSSANYLNKADDNNNSEDIEEESDMENNDTEETGEDEK